MVAICMHKRKRLGAEDILISMSFVVGVVLVGVQTWAIVDEGQGYHQRDISGSQLAKAAKSLLVSEALWSLVSGLLRVAAGLMIYKIFGVIAECRWSALLIMITSAALALASVVQIFLICRPFAAQWDPRVLGTCGDQMVSFMILESTGLILDIAILAVPAMAVVGLTMKKSRKAQAILVLDMEAM